MKNRKFLLIAFVTLFANALSGQDLSTITGTITDSSEYNIGYANVTVNGTKYGTTANRFGKYELQVPSGNNTIIVSCIGYQTIKKEISVETGKKIEINFILPFSFEKLDEIKVSGRSENTGTIQRIDAKSLYAMPNASGNIENVVKYLPGVSSNNELSSQYNVRGGSFDENLVYVNNIEIFRPQLIRSGQQEGLSFVNPDMVGSLKFSAGGFDASYGDKMSSVLDINYRRPEKNEGSFSASLLGTNGYFEGISKNSKFRHLTGIRYKTSQYLLTSMDTKGEYKPTFTDVQTNMTYDFSPKFELSFLGNYSQNKYEFIPSDRTTLFGTFTQKVQFKVYYEGQEKDMYSNALGALTFNYHDKDIYSFKLIASAYTTSETETYDLLGQYNISEIRDTKTRQTDSTQILAIGSFLNNARNFLDINIISLSHLGNFNVGINKLKWGITYQQEQINDKLKEWDMVDSAGYILPYNPNAIQLSNSRRAINDVSSSRIMGFVQNTFEFSPGNDKLFLTAGIRAHYWSLNNETIYNPRISISYKPSWKEGLLLYISSGMYNQPEFYKELRDPQGKVNRNIQAQQSTHFVIGADYMFYAFSRPFKITSELYYKLFDNLIPYKVDNVRTVYAGYNLASGYARGFDFKLNGEFVKGTESWFSMSIMQTEERITKVDSIRTDYYPRPTNQFLNMSLYFQDYLPRNPSYKAHISIHYGSSLPAINPFSKNWGNTFPLPSYKRVDMGFSKLLKGEESVSKNRFTRFIKEAWISAEIFNVLNIQNTISLTWIKSVGLKGESNGIGYFGVPNFLTSRRLNIKLSVSF
jgi:hypothetical protein